MHTTLKMEYLVSVVIIICNLFIATTKYRFRFPFKEVLKVFSFFYSELHTDIQYTLCKCHAFLMCRWRGRD